MAERAGRMTLRTGFDAARQHVLLQIEEGDKAWAHITLELPEFTDLQRDLARYRQQFSETVPMELEPGAKAEAAVDPRWQVMTGNPGLPEGAVLLQIRHPGYGWLHFAVPEASARKMGKVLARATR